MPLLGIEGMDLHDLMHESQGRGIGIEEPVRELPRESVISSFFGEAHWNLNAPLLSPTGLAWAMTAPSVTTGATAAATTAARPTSRPGDGPGRDAAPGTGEFAPIPIFTTNEELMELFDDEGDTGADADAVSKDAGS